MSEGNILFLVCEPCSQTDAKDFGIKLAERSRVGFYEPVTPENQFQQWLGKHARCGGRDVDHFKLGYLRPHNEDQVKLKVVHAVADAITEMRQ